MGHLGAGPVPERERGPARRRGHGHRDAAGDDGAGARLGRRELRRDVAGVRGSSVHHELGDRAGLVVELVDGPERGRRRGQAHLLEASVEEIRAVRAGGLGHEGQAVEGEVARVRVGARLAGLRVGEAERDRLHRPQRPLGKADVLDAGGARPRQVREPAAADEHRSNRAHAAVRPDRERRVRDRRGAGHRDRPRHRRVAAEMRCGQVTGGRPAHPRARLDLGGARVGEQRPVRGPALEVAVGHRAERWTDGAEIAIDADLVDRERVALTVDRRAEAGLGRRPEEEARRAAKRPLADAHLIGLRAVDEGHGVPSAVHRDAEPLPVEATDARAAQRHLEVHDQRVGAARLGHGEGLLDAAEAAHRVGIEDGHARLDHRRPDGGPRARHHEGGIRGLAPPGALAHHEAVAGAAPRLAGAVDARRPGLAHVGRRARAAGGPRDAPAAARAGPAGAGPAAAAGHPAAARDARAGGAAGRTAGAGGHPTAARRGPAAAAAGLELALGLGARRGDADGGEDEEDRGKARHSFMLRQRAGTRQAPRRAGSGSSSSRAHPQAGRGRA